ncbi:retron system putative HNH endonuclease [Candidatus Accumulibacter sp. ACC003]|uniref:retron system putative HNH endonuclease n=1 Tax=Candidatus Accumulibacter sp. ACC003 TaxID=2823334 RepID=UPI0025B9E218|nr:retron system putative HNH endonuclease [Candidatus Accumulibacter sp. ACC003]
MHKLDRSGVAAPDCLDGYDYKTQTWDDFGNECKKLLRAALVQMQGSPGVTTEDASEYGVRCAYCEGQIFHEGHIEHFRRKNLKHHPELTFDWHNLFLACGSKWHCGHYKDRKSAPPYDPEQLIKPDEHDPEDYLYFHSSGEVRVRDQLSAADKLRADATIRVFGLDNQTLAGKRARAVSKFRQMKSEDFEEIASWGDFDRRKYFEGEIEATRWEPYATTIKHFLQRT